MLPGLKASSNMHSRAAMDQAGNLPSEERVHMSSCGTMPLSCSMIPDPTFPSGGCLEIAHWPLPLGPPLTMATSPGPHSQWLCCAAHAISATTALLLVVTSLPRASICRRADNYLHPAPESSLQPRAPLRPPLCMASPSTSSSTKAAGHSGAAVAADAASKPGQTIVLDQRPPTPPTSDTEPFPVLDVDHIVTEDGAVERGDSEAAGGAADDHNESPTDLNATAVDDAPDTTVGQRGGLALQTGVEVTRQQHQENHLNVEIESARSQPSPVTPPYWSHPPASPERHPFLSSPRPESTDTHAGHRGHAGGASSASSDTTVSPTTPRSSYDRYSHGRSMTTTSIDSLMAEGGITLRDNENSSIDDRGSACWARSVVIRDYVTVNGGATNIGAFVVWNVRVETLSGSHMNICKRYSEFDDLRSRLIRSFPSFAGAVPELPPKSLISKFRPSFLEKRRAGLQYFLNCIMLNPEFSGSPILKEFLFS
ncbi:uncharacterized protein B0I36DRAFT_327488 [Microdochium trichocladiopsis]|uniref:Endosomal/vacuolar adapter protein YPT35 n=1 Tax=Microdochium trichocladiopsis TaxID=1682393 RepID=A0A9P8Y4W3_9PEZI|nr:uncharacterized protein B0I36DRAFT_327488 [Microdochium trichocladiopsis]KAH7027621.1 hypothetical protein B0I36DRAFT_327488 [Microdochium trichocladiopsis]